MIKKLLLIAIVLLPFQTFAVDGGIKFFHGTYEEALVTAEAENKMVFIDFVTEWCGPCKLMAREVFPLDEVGDVYNKNFISIKLDAESDKYSPLAKAFKVKSYPTYLFIDPKSEQIAHRSGSRQSVEDFIRTGKQAISDMYNSVNINKLYSNGDRSRELLEQYVLYLKSNNSSKEMGKVFKELMDLPDVDLTNNIAWGVFFQKINGIDNVYFQNLMSDSGLLRNHFGDAVDIKIEKEFSLHLQRAAHACLYGGKDEDKELYKSAVEKVKGYSFPNKKLILTQAEAIYLLALRDYIKMHELVVGVLSDNELSYELKSQYFKQFVGYAYAVKDDIDYLNRMVVYARYFAYNVKDMKDVSPHFKYAEVLEKIYLNSDVEKDGFLTTEPAFGVKSYSLRPKDLKRKPKR